MLPLFARQFVKGMINNDEGLAPVGAQCDVDQVGGAEGRTGSQPVERDPLGRLEGGYCASDLVLTVGMQVVLRVRTADATLEPHGIVVRARARPRAVAGGSGQVGPDRRTRRADHLANP